MCGRDVAPKESSLDTQRQIIMTLFIEEYSADMSKGEGQGHALVFMHAMPHERYWDMHMVHDLGCFHGLVM